MVGFSELAQDREQLGARGVTLRQVEVVLELGQVTRSRLATLERAQHANAEIVFGVAAGLLQGGGGGLGPAL